MKVELLFITPEAERLIERAGRTAYLSFSKEGKDTEKAFIRMLIKGGHLSVLEHAYATVRISGVSRAFTHQLVRHRLCSFTQQSQRYVDESNFSYVEPPAVEKSPQAHSVFVDFMDKAKRTYQELQQMKIRKEDARFVLPNAVESQIVVTANLREWRHIIGLRTTPGAQWEIKQAAIEILEILRQHAPTVFEDLAVEAKKAAAA